MRATMTIKELIQSFNGKSKRQIKNIILKEKGKINNESNIN